MRWLRRLALAIVGAALVMLAAGQIGLLRGSPPSDLGVHEGRLKAPSTTPNSVSSQAMLWPGNPQHENAQIAPLPAHGDAETTMASLRVLVAAQPDARVVEARRGYLRAEFTSRWLHFVDDVEFWFDPAAGVVQLRSASRLGDGDLGVNRARIEAIRAAWASAKP